VNAIFIWAADFVYKCYCIIFNKIKVRLSETNAARKRQPIFRLTVSFINRPFNLYSIAELQLVNLAVANDLPEAIKKAELSDC
jgi:hypothetical protein